MLNENKRAIFDKKNVLVIGGAGFLGSHLCDELIKTSKVICIDNFISGEERNIDHLLAEPDFVFLKHDICEPIDLESIPSLQKFKIEFQGIQEIYNLACPMSTLNFKKNSINTLHANSLGIKNSLDIALRYYSKYMQFSSSVVYGPRREGNPKISESDIGYVDFTSERSCYDEGKRFAETMVTTYRTFYGLDVKVVRLFRVYGPRMKLNDGQMIPDFVNNAIEGKDVVIQGDENFSSSFCYVSDAIDAAVKIMESNLAQPVNIGSDVVINITDFAKKIISMLGSKSKIVYDQELLFMSQLCVPDTALARNELGWMPIVTLTKGLEKTIEDLLVSKGLKKIEY